MSNGIRVTDTPVLSAVDELFGVYNGTSGRFAVGDLAPYVGLPDYGLGEDAGPLVGDVDTWYRGGLAYGYGGAHPSASAGDNPYPYLNGLFYLNTTTSDLVGNAEYVHQTAFYVGANISYSMVRSRATGAWSAWVPDGEQRDGPDYRSRVDHVIAELINPVLPLTRLTGSLDERVAHTLQTIPNAD